jgi:uncharacterized iron-regulated membrane protein
MKVKTERKRMKSYKIVWQMHKWVGIVSALILVNVSVTGLLLLEKKKVAWLQPPTQTGQTGTAADFISIAELFAAVAQIQHPDFPDAAAVDRVDLRPAKRVFKVRSRFNRAEVQVDAVNGRILSIAPRRSDLLEALHDGSWFGAWMHGWVMPLAAVANLLLVLTGLTLWLKRAWPRRSKTAPPPRAASS